MNTDKNESTLNKRHDSPVIRSFKQAKFMEDCYNKASNGKEYNTIEKVPGGYIVTNKFDPFCDDKTSLLGVTHETD